MTPQFASKGDLDDKTISFTQLSEHAYAYTTEGDPNTGVVIGDESVLVIDTQATPKMAQDVIEKIRTVTDKPIETVVLSHYHAVRVLGASAFQPKNIVCSRYTRDLIVERGEQDYASEAGRFPRLFRGIDSVPGLTWPTMTFEHQMTIWLGSVEVQLLHLGKGHTKGDTVVWLPQEQVLFAGDLVEYGATPYTGDAYLSDWPQTLDRLEALSPTKVAPGRGAALVTPEQVKAGIEGTRAFIQAMFASVQQSRQDNLSLEDAYSKARTALDPHYQDWVIYEHCLPFNIKRAYDEAGGLTDPKIWTAELDEQMWHDLQNVLNK